MNILQQIQNDLLDPSVPLSVIMRKAKVLAHQLRSNELDSWVSQELDGYAASADVPYYRIIPIGCVGTVSNGISMVRNTPILMHKIKNKELLEALKRYRAHDGIRKVEERADGEPLNFKLSGTFLALADTYLSRDYWHYVGITLFVPREDFAQILDTVRNRLLDFVLKLSGEWHIEASPPAVEDVKKLVSSVIYSVQGGSVTVFDQRGQQVKYQYNAAGNINITGAQNKDGLAEELEKLKHEVERAKDSGALDQDLAIETGYHLVQATKAAKNSNPDKSAFMNHMQKARALIENVSAVAGLVSGMASTIEVASKIFR